MIRMLETKSISKNKKFSGETKVLSIRVPKKHFQAIKKIFYDFLADFKEDNNSHIISMAEGFQEMIGIIKEISNSFLGDSVIYKPMFNEILVKHNLDLIDYWIKTFDLDLE